MVAEPIKPLVTKMPPKKSCVGRKFKSLSKDANLRFAKAASAAAVANTGNVSAAEVSQLYVSSTCSPALPFPTPRLSLRGFVKNHLAPGTKAALRFELTSDDFAISSGNCLRMLQDYR